LSVTGGDATGPPNDLSDRVRSLRLPDANQTAPRTSRLPWFLTLVLAGVIAWLVYRDQNRVASAPVEIARPSAESNAALTPTGETAGETGVALESKGYIIPAHQILVTPQVNGRILKLNIEEGRRVKQGEVLAELETTDFLADVARAEALLAAARQKLLELERGTRPEEIEQVKAELAETITNRDQLEADWRRNEKLRATQAITDREYEQSESQFRAMEHRAARLRQLLKLMVDGPRVERIDLAKAEVKQAEADVTKARWRLDNCTIRAPVSGTILKKNAEEGNIVNPIAFNGSFSLCEMADLSDLEVDLAIQERDVARVFPGQRCKVRAEAFPDRAYDGVVSRLMPIADRAKGAIPVRVKLSIPAEEEGVYLKPEMGAVVSFLRNEGTAEN
jgi:multidrug resistance efflux pump